MHAWTKVGCTRRAKRVFILSGVFLALFLFVGYQRAGAQCEPGELAKLIPEGVSAGDCFGYSVSISGDGQTALIGAAKKKVSGVRCGAAYIYRLRNSKWVEEAMLVDPGHTPDDYFGCSVSISGDGTRAVVGAYGDDDLGDRSGSAHIFAFNGAEWIHEAKLIASDGQESAVFGQSVSIGNNGRTVLVGAPQDSGVAPLSGSAYIFERDGSQWSETTKLLASDSIGYESFGFSVAISRNGDTVIVGRPHSEDNGPLSGSAYVFFRSSDDWVEQARLLARHGDERDYFGNCVAISGDGDTAIIGALNYDRLWSDAGWASVYRREGTAWRQTATLVPSDGASSKDFGEALAISHSGDVVVIGAEEDSESERRAGAAYIFAFDRLKWREKAKLLASDPQDFCRFGFSVSVADDDETVFVGARGADDRGTSTGATYVYDLNCDWPCLSLQVDNLVAGQRARFVIAGGTSGARAVTVWGYRHGKVAIDGLFDICAEFSIAGVRQKGRVIRRSNRVFDSHGAIVFYLEIPDDFQGDRILFQSAQQGTCPDECVSNLVEQTVR